MQMQMIRINNNKNHWVDQIAVNSAQNRKQSLINKLYVCRS